MNKFFQSVLATLTASAIVANVVVLWQFNERLTRIETILSAHSSTPLASNK